MKATIASGRFSRRTLLSLSSPRVTGNVIVFFSPRATHLVPSSSTIVYCFIRWITFLGVFKKRESLCLFAGSFKTVSPDPLAPSFRVAAQLVCVSRPLFKKKKKLFTVNLNRNDAIALTFCLKLPRRGFNYALIKKTR